jgi:transcriptional regulator with XRE-family HTH domain
MAGEVEAELRKAFGLRVAELRIKRGESQEDLGFRAGMHPQAIGELERGRRMPRLDTVIKVAGSLGVQAGDLLAGLGWEPGEFIAGSLVVGPEDRAPAKGGES